MRTVEYAVSCAFEIMQNIHYIKFCITIIHTPSFCLIVLSFSYAVFYSCWKVLLNGSCDPAKTYAFVIQRNQQPTDNGIQREIIQALKLACIEFSDLTPVKHYGYCEGNDGF